MSVTRWDSVFCYENTDDTGKEDEICEGKGKWQNKSGTKIKKNKL
jgi:hypothetical protein